MELWSGILTVQTANPSAITFHCGVIDPMKRTVVQWEREYYERLLQACLQFLAKDTTP